MGKIASGPAKLGNLEFDAVTSMAESLSAESPEYVTESGYCISDHKIIKSTQMTVQGKIANRPVTWANIHTPSSSRISEGRRQLLKLFTDKELVSYQQNGVTWDNMSLDGLELPDNPEDGDVLNFTVKLKQITVTETEMVLVVISFPRGGTTSTNTGSASAAKSKSSTKNSGGKSDFQKSVDLAQSKGKAQTEHYQNSQNKASILYSAGQTIGLFK